MKTVFVDSREPMTTGSELSLKLPADTHVETALMTFGDVVWFTDTTSFGFEFKSTSDLISSLWRRDRGERLERQLTGLRENYGNSFLCIHGLLLPDQNGMLIAKEPVQARDNTLTSKVQARTKISAKQLESFLYSIEHPTSGNPVRVIWRPTKDAVLEAVGGIYTNSQRGTHSTFNHVLSSAKPKVNKEEDQWLAIYMSIRGIGEATAKKLVAEFGSPASVISHLQTHGIISNPHAKHRKVLTPALQVILRKGFGIPSGK